jgi:hypothetical protein
MGLVETVGGAAAVLKAVKEIKDTLDGNRSVVLVVANYTGYTLKVYATQHDHGGFKENPSGEIPPGATDVFSSRDRGFMTGTEGVVIYKLEGTDIYFSIDWNNPYVGSNSSSAAVYRRGEGFLAFPKPVNTFDVYTSTGAGDQDAEMLYELRPL